MSDSLSDSITPEKCPVTRNKQKNSHTKKKLNQLQAEVCPTLRCSVCPEKRFRTLTEYDEHFLSKRHLRRKVNYTFEAKETTPSSDALERRTWRCRTCKRTFQYYHDWFKHLTSPTHLRILEDAAKALTQNKRPAYTLNEVRKVEWLVQEQGFPEED